MASCPEYVLNKNLEVSIFSNENQDVNRLENGNAIVATIDKVNSTNFTLLEQLEDRLAVGRTIQDEATTYALYNSYGSIKGFNVRIGKNRKSRDGTWVIAKSYLCNCEGFPDKRTSKDKVPVYQKKSFRCGCEAKLRIGRSKGENVWKVTGFDVEHNHELYPPDQTYLLKSSRYLSDDNLVFLNSMVSSGVPITKAFDVIKNMSNGRENVGFIPKDLYNTISREKRKSKFEYGDSNELVRYFMKKTNLESNFYWNVEIDDEKHLMNFFFRDNRCRTDYECFSDVVTFDTTYKTNKHDLVCAPFVGINHHKDNILFGLGFLSDEKEETFEWLFRIFLESMGGKQPVVIFTDQCQAMMNAIDNVFPSSHHRLCQWHIGQNISGNFGILKDDKRLSSLWNKCMSFCDSEEEFETTWKIMMDEYNLHERYWFNMMYKNRQRWANVFSHHLFSAGLVATSRSEGTNTTLKKSLGKKVNYASLLDCVISYEQVQESWRSIEKENDTVSFLQKPGIFHVVEKNPLIQHAASIYTHAIFGFFQRELFATMGIKCTYSSANDGSSVQKFFMESHGKDNMVRVVEYDNQNMEIKCSCHHFETNGILCAHALKVLDTVNLPAIPEKYILHRWTKNAKQTAGDGDNTGKHSSNEEHTFVSEMSFAIQATKKWNEVVMRGKSHVETQQILTEGLQIVREKLDIWFQNMKLDDLVPNSELVTEKNAKQANEVVVRDPLYVFPQFTGSQGHSHALNGDYVPSHDELC